MDIVYHKLVDAVIRANAIVVDGSTKGRSKQKLTLEAIDRNTKKVLLIFFFWKVKISIEQTKRIWITGAYHTPETKHTTNGKTHKFFMCFFNTLLIKCFHSSHQLQLHCLAANPKPLTKYNANQIRRSEFQQMEHV